MYKKFHLIRKEFKYDIFKMKNNLFKPNKLSFFSTSKIDYSFDTRDFLKKVEEYETKLDDHDKSKYIVIKDEPLLGFATEEGTNNYSMRNTDEVVADHFRVFYGSNLKVSSIGIGTYTGAPDDINDFYIYNAVKSCIISGGINLIDTAINYRYMKSERAVGMALRTLCAKYNYCRNEFIVSSKIGFVPEDADNGKRSHSFVQHLVEGNKITMEDIIFDDKSRPVHCIHPEYLKDQLDLSLRNLGLNTLDILYLHNIFESQGAILPSEQFEERLTKAFEFLEQARKENKIKLYGMSTWNCFRTPSNNPGLHCNLQKVVELAERVGGRDHGFRVIQVPINIMHPEAFVENYQNFSTIEKGVVPATLTAVCSTLKINLISCSPLLQGYMVNLPMENIVFGVKNNAVKHIQLIRSVPADCLKSTLVGMKAMSNIKTNLEIIGKLPLTSQQFYDVLTPKKRTPYVEKDMDNN